MHPPLRGHAQDYNVLIEESGIVSALRYHVAVCEVPEWYAVWRDCIAFETVEYGGQSLVGTRQGYWRAE
jgi:hypothetical protein